MNKASATDGLERYVETIGLGIVATTVLNKKECVMSDVLT